MLGKASQGETGKGVLPYTFASLLFFSISLTSAGFSDNQSAEEHFHLAAKYTQEGKLDEAEREYRLGLKISRSPEAYNNLGTIYFGRRRLPGAVAAFEQAHRLEPANPEISFNLGLALYQAGDLGKAIPHLRAGAAALDHVADAHYLLGASYFGLKQWQRSVGELELARGQGTVRPEVLFLLVKAHRNVGEPTKSLEAAAELLKTYPDSPLVHEILGEAYDTASQLRGAENESKAAIAASPHAPQLHFLLGYLYWRWKRYADAVAPFKDEVQINPNFAPSYFYLGDLALKEGQREQALDYFGKAARLDASYGEAYLGMGRANVALGRSTESIDFFRQAIRLMPDRTEPYHWLGRTLIQLGRKEEGRKQLAKAEQINASKQRQVPRIYDSASTKVGSSAGPLAVPQPGPAQNPHQ
jgi:tetratricopeptide (TPR) repeat protein